MCYRTWLAVVVLGVCGSLAAVPRAAAEQDETGPNFAVPEDLADHARKQYARALEAYERARSATSGRTALIATAIKELEKSKRLARGFAPPSYYLGILHQWTRDYDKARRELIKACKLNPRFHQAVIELGDVYAWLEQPKKAFAEYERAIAMKPDYPHAYIMRGIVRLREGEYPGALADLEKAESLESKDPLLERIKEMAKHEVEGPGWEKTHACETDHYRIITPVSQEFADELGMHAEIIHKTYTKIFPKIDKKDRKFTIVVYATQSDYHAAGGPEGAGGHYNSLLRKLHLFKYDDPANTRLVLYHEGFHQFLHDYFNDSPQWFDEGVADFFGPSEYIPPPVKGGRTRGEGSIRLRPNPWRLELIKKAIQANRVRSWRELMLMSQAEMYDPEWAGIHYAQAWAIVYFLIRGGAPPDANAGPYFKILQNYFRALRRGASQEAAFNAAFGRYDVAKLEREWKEFIVGLEMGQ